MQHCTNPDLVGQTGKLKSLTKPEEFVGQPDSTRALAFIHEEPDWDVPSVNHVERINDVVESQLGRLPNQFILAE